MTDEHDPVPEPDAETVDEIEHVFDEEPLPSYDPEEAFLTALLAEQDPGQALWRIHLEPDHFASVSHSIIFETCLLLRDRSEHIEALSIAEALPTKYRNSDVFSTVWRLGVRQIHYGQVEFYADQVLAAWRRRSLANLGRTLEGMAKLAPGEQLEAVVQAEVDRVMHGAASDARLQDTDVTLLDRAFGERPPTRSVPTPFTALNDAIGGFRPGGLYVLAADTGLGKSAIALQCTQAMTRRGGRAIFVTMEMSEGEQQDRLISQNCAVVLNHVERQHYPDEIVRERVERFVETPVPIRFLDKANLPVSEIARVAFGTEELCGMTIDYLQLMDLARIKGENLTDSIGRTTKGLKNLARELDIPILVLSQLNREAARAGRPTRHHLLGSGAIANDADVIMLLWREDPMMPGTLTLIVDKNRQGPEGDIDLRWEGDFVRAVDFFAP